MSNPATTPLPQPRLHPLEMRARSGRLRPARMRGGQPVGQAGADEPPAAGKEDHRQLPGVTLNDVRTQRQASLVRPGAGHADPGPVLRSRLDVRAQTRRRAVPGLPRRERGAPDDPQPEDGQQYLPRARRGARRPAAGRLRGGRGGGRVLRRPDPLRPAAAADADRPAVRGAAAHRAGSVLPVRRALGGRHRPAPGAAAGTQAAAAPAPGLRRPAALHRSPGR